MQKKEEFCIMVSIKLYTSFKQYISSSKSISENSFSSSFQTSLSTLDEIVESLVKKESEIEAKRIISSYDDTKTSKPQTPQFSAETILERLEQSLRIEENIGYLSEGEKDIPSTLRSVANQINGTLMKNLTGWSSMVFGNEEKDFKIENIRFNLLVYRILDGHMLNNQEIEDV